MDPSGPVGFMIAPGRFLEGGENRRADWLISFWITASVITSTAFEGSIVQSVGMGLASRARVTARVMASRVKGF